MIDVKSDKTSLRLAFAAALAPIAILIFWAVNPSFLLWLLNGSPQMVPWTAVSILFICASVVAASEKKTSLSRLLGTLGAGLGLLFLFEYLGQFHFGFDTWLFNESVHYNPALRFPGRPSPQTSLAVFALSGALIVFSYDGFQQSLRRRWVLQIFATVAMGIAVLAGFGYLFDAAHLFSITQFTGISVLTAASVAILSFAVFYLDREFGFIHSISQENASGLFLRRFVIGGVFAPCLVAILIGILEQNEILNVTDGMALFVFFTIVLIALLASYVARSLSRIEEQSKSLESQRVEIASALQAARIKDSFVTNMSHELRTPMTAILGYLDLLREPLIADSERINLATKAERSARGLLGVLDDVLDIAKIEANRMSIVPVTFSIKSLIDDVLSVLMLEAERKSLRLRADYESDIPTEIISDPQRVRQVLLNLLGNAVKFTHSGTVTLSVKLKNPSSLVFEINDTGIGISEAQQSQLFQAFYQADDTITRKYGGTGLGLAISRNFAQLLGGRLVLSMSRAGQGSTFVFELPFTLPAKEPAQAPEAKKLPADLRGADVLLAEDNLDNQFLITRYLKSAGANVEVAQNGQEALEKALQKTYTVILMDLQMPVMGGLEATKALRESGYAKPIVALSAHVRDEHRAMSIAAGCTAHYGKPIAKNELLDLVRNYAT